jgi:hypothetical protein
MLAAQVLQAEADGSLCGRTDMQSTEQQHSHAHGSRKMIFQPTSVQPAACAQAKVDRGQHPAAAVRASLAFQ